MRNAIMSVLIHVSGIGNALQKKTGPTDPFDFGLGQKMTV